MRAILCNNTRVKIPDLETNFFPLWVSLSQRFGDLSVRRNFSRFYGYVSRFPFFYYARQRQKEISERLWYEEAHPHRLSDVFSALIRLYTGYDCTRDVLWGDKSPTYVRHTGLLMEHFPTAQFLHIIRDGRDCCLSARNAWGNSVYRTAQRWNDAVLSPARDLATRKEALCEIRYEDLLRSPEATMAQVFERLGLEWSSHFVTTVDSGEPLGAGASQEEIVSKNSRQFVSQISARQLSRISRIAGDGLSKYGYQNGAASTIRLSWAEMNVYRIADATRQVLRRVGDKGLVHSLGFVYRFFRQNWASEVQLKRK